MIEDAQERLRPPVAREFADWFDIAPQDVVGRPYRRIIEARTVRIGRIVMGAQGGMPGSFRIGDAAGHPRCELPCSWSEARPPFWCREVRQPGTRIRRHHSARRSIRSRYGPRRVLRPAVPAFERPAMSPRWTEERRETSQLEPAGRHPGHEAQPIKGVAKAVFLTWASPAVLEFTVCN